MVREDGHINVTGITARSTFNGDVEILGTLFGGSPVKIGGGLSILSGDVFSSGDIEGNQMTANAGIQVPSGNINVSNNISVLSTLVAQEIVDLTHAYDRNSSDAFHALVEVKKVPDGKGGFLINHSSLPDFAKINTVRGEGRSLGAMISIITESMQWVKNLTTTNQNRIDSLEAELCRKDPTYSWC